VPADESAQAWLDAWDPMSELVDWDLAVATARRLAPKGPPIQPKQALEAVRMIRGLAVQAIEPVERVTGMSAGPPDGAQVVDRAAWIQSNADGMREALQPLMERIDGREPPALLRDLGSRGSAVQVGIALAWLSGKVLGQYEAFAPAGQQGRLLLVAPTIVQVERQLGVPERDFRLWVCLHEETHRLQFGANPWLSDYMRSLIADFLEATELGVVEVAQRLASAIATGVRGARPASLVEAVQSPAQRAVFDRMTGLMSLLEGHAEVVMDEVGPQVVPSVALIRERFNQRRAQPKALDAAARRLMGMDVKMRQYSEGAAFVRQVVNEVGMAGFNRVWTGPATLPSREEIMRPQQWIDRMRVLTPMPMAGTAS